MLLLLLLLLLLQFDFALNAGLIFVFFLFHFGSCKSIRKFNEFPAFLSTLLITVLFPHFLSFSRQGTTSPKSFGGGG